MLSLGSHRPITLSGLLGWHVPKFTKIIKPYFGPSTLFGVGLIKIICVIIIIYYLLCIFSKKLFLMLLTDVWKNVT